MTNPSQTKNKHEIQSLTQTIDSVTQRSVHIIHRDELTIHERKEQNTKLYNSLPDNHKVTSTSYADVDDGEFDYY